jgi:hypothetical protein
MGAQIACHLLSRYDTSRCPHANIRTLFELFDVLDDDAFAAFCSKSASQNGHAERARRKQIMAQASSTKPR